MVAVSRLGGADRLRHLIASDIKPRQLLYAAVRHGLIDSMVDAPASSNHVASLLGLDHDAVHRVLRGLVALELAEQATPDRFALTALGTLLSRKEPDTLRGEVLLAGERDQAWCALSHTLRTGETAYRHAHGAGIFEMVDQDAHRALAFHRWMADGSDDLEAIAADCPVPATGKIVDVGGGRGDFLAALLKQHPALHGVVFDVDIAVEEASSVFDHAQMADRYAVEVGDFFSDVPANGNVYVLQRILHDWDDGAAGLILERVRRRMATTATLLVIEKILGEQVTENPGVTFLDLDMLVEVGGRQRTVAEFERLLADHGLRLQRVIRRETEPSILVAVLDSQRVP